MKNRIVGIDFLRGFAVLLVLFRHIYCEPVFISVGWLGVDLFFVLSGFLVSNLLFKEYIRENNIKPIKFLIRRGFKIYPLYYLMLLLLFGIMVYREPSYLEVYKYRLFIESVFIQNYFYSDTLIGHTWSLAVEEHFYIGLAIILMILSKIKLLENKIVFNVLSLAIFFLALNMRINIIDNYSDKFTFKQFLIPTHLRMDTLWVGVFISYHYNFNYSNFLKNTTSKGFIGLGILPFLIALSYPFDTKFLPTWGLTLIAFGFGALLTGLLANSDRDKLLIQIFGNKIYGFVSKLGMNSYAIYLFHMMIVWYCTPYKSTVLFNSLEGRINCLVPFVISIIVGFVLTKYVEMPILKWRDKIIS